MIQEDIRQHGWIQGKGYDGPYIVYEGRIQGKGYDGPYIVYEGRIQGKGYDGPYIVYEGRSVFFFCPFVVKATSATGAF